MERSPGRLGPSVLVCCSLAACAPSIGGLVAGSGGGSSSTVVNATVDVAAPAAYVASATMTVTMSTTPAGQAVEASLDGGGWQAVPSTWQITGMADGAHSARVRVAGNPASERSITWTVDTVAPTAATGLVVAPSTAGRLLVSWAPGSDGGSGIASHRIDYGTQSGAADAAVSAAAPAVSQALTGLSSCETYFVTVTSVDRAGNTSAATAEVSARANCGGDGTFVVTTTTLGTQTPTLASGDFDGDGVLDLAVADTSTLRILIGGGADGRGDGTFTAGESYATSAWIDDLTVGDFDDDGILDLALVNDRLRIYLGDGADGRGDGTFTVGETLTTNLVTPGAVFAQDFDADGIDDLVVGDWSGDRLVVFLGDGSGGQGDGTFTYGSQLNTGRAPGAIASGDFDADGIADLAVACQSGGECLVTHLGNGSGGRGDGTFAAAQTWLSGGFVAGDVVVADMNGDRIDDLIVPLALANAVVFLAGAGTGGKGTGNFYLDEVVGVSFHPWGIVKGEFTGDNIVDYVSFSYLDDGATLLTAGGSDGRGDGTFTTSSIGGEGVSLFHGVVGDVDGNGSLDIVCGDLDGGLTVFANNGNLGIGDGTFAARGGEPTAIGNAYGVAARDLDSDRVPDVMIASFQQPYPGGSDFVLRYLNTQVGGLGTGALPTGQLLFVGSGPTAFAFGDFQRDGIEDIAVLCSDLELRGGGDRVDVMLGGGTNGVGDGSFGVGASYAAGTTPRALVSGDFDDDGIVDLVVVGFASDDVTVLLGDGSDGVGDGTFTAQAPFAAGDGPFCVVRGDFDGDGIEDLAIGRAPTGGGGEVRILIGDGADGVGDGTFSAGETYATANAVASLAAGDFDGDGITDLVATQHRTSGATASSGVIVFTGDGGGGRGDGTFTAGGEVAVGGNAYAVVVADFDGDKILDLAVTDADAPALKVLLGGGGDGRGDGTFGAPASAALFAPSVALTATDLDCDGIVDLVAVGGERVSVLFGRGSY